MTFVADPLALVVAAILELVTFDFSFGHNGSQVDFFVRWLALSLSFCHF